MVDWCEKTGCIVPVVFQIRCKITTKKPHLLVAPVDAVVVAVVVTTVF